jgi:hypothetical protein
MSSPNGTPGNRSPSNQRSGGDQDGRAHGRSRDGNRQDGGRRIYAHRKHALFVGPWDEQSLERVWQAVEAGEQAVGPPAPEESEALRANNRRRLPRRWLCAVYRLSMTQDYYTALRYDFDQALVAHRVDALVEAIEAWAQSSIDQSSAD